MSFKTYQRFPNIEQNVNSKSLLWSRRSFMIWSSHNFQAFCTMILLRLTTYCAVVILVFLLLLKQVQFIPNLGHLHLLFSLQGNIFFKAHYPYHQGFFSNVVSCLKELSFLCHSLFPYPAFIFLLSICYHQKLFVFLLYISPYRRVLWGQGSCLFGLPLYFQDPE